MIYLLDSNVWIALIRRSSAVLAARYFAMAPSADNHDLLDVQSVHFGGHAAGGDEQLLDLPYAVFQ
jgi:hypothetical protein